jgi:DegV family protein with EDD domain
MKIITDSAADLTPQEIRKYQIQVAPLTIHFPDGAVNSEEISADEFYSRMADMQPGVPTTSQPSTGVFQQMYQKIAESGEEILSLHISSGLSGTAETARLGASHVPNARVCIWDTLTLSGGQRFQVLAAAEAARCGWSVGAITERLKKIRENSETAFTLETIDYLARGGRIGRVQALAGHLLKIKPLISVDHQDGKYNSFGKARTLSRAMEMVVDHQQEVFGRDTRLWVSVMHGQFQAQAELMLKMMRDRMNVVREEILRISPVLGVHTGPGVVGVAAVPYDLLEGLEPR